MRMFFGLWMLAILGACTMASVLLLITLFTNSRGPARVAHRLLLTALFWPFFLAWGIMFVLLMTTMFAVSIFMAVFQRDKLPLRPPKK